MTDISKCQGTGCQKKEQCYRFLAKSSPYQPYLIPESVESCKYFLVNYSGGKAGTPDGGKCEGLTTGKVGPDNVNCPP